MEDIFIRCPHILDIVCGYLDYESLEKCRLVNKSFFKLFDRKIYWIRAIQKFLVHHYRKGLNDRRENFTGQKFTRFVGNHLNKKSSFSKMQIETSKYTTLRFKITMNSLYNMMSKYFCSLRIFAFYVQTLFYHKTFHV